MNSSSLDILFVIDSLGPGGAQNQLSQLAIKLKEIGHKVSVFTYYPHNFFKPSLEKKNIEVYYQPKQSKLGLRVIIRLIKIIRRGSYDAVISFLDTPNLYAVIANKISNRSIPVIISYRSKTDFSKLNALSLKVKESINKYADHIVANSIHEKNNWKKKYPELDHKLATIYNAVDLRRFKPTTINGKALKKNKLLIVGKCRPLKNGLLVIEAMKILKNREELNFKLCWVGVKDFEQKDFVRYVNKMTQLLDLYELGSYWEWLPPVKTIESCYTDCDAVLHPSLWEGLPNVVCEALSTGVPVLASSILDHPILVAQGERGFLFDPKSAAELADAISDFYRLSREDAQKMGANARDFAENNFDAGKIANKWINLIQQ